jgi:hypothetical protein
MSSRSAWVGDLEQPFPGVWRCLAKGGDHPRPIGRVDEGNAIYDEIVRHVAVVLTKFLCRAGAEMQDAGTGRT